MVIGLVVPDASRKVAPPLVEYWYFVKAGTPPVEPVKATDNVDSELFTGETTTDVGAVPSLYVLTDADAVELEDVHIAPETAFIITE